MKSYFILLISFLLLACGTKKQENGTETTAEAGIETSVSLNPDQLKNAGITVGKPVIKPISAILKLNGSIDVPPQNMVSISFPLGGYLKSSKLLPGMHVRKGEVLAVMEDAQFIQIQQDLKIRLVVSLHFAVIQQESIILQPVFMHFQTIRREIIILPMAFMRFSLIQQDTTIPQPVFLHLEIMRRGMIM